MADSEAGQDIARAARMKPNILNSQWRYTNSVETDVRKTIAKERKRLALAAKLREEAEARPASVAKRAIGGGK